LDSVACRQGAPSDVTLSADMQAISKRPAFFAALVCEINSEIAQERKGAARRRR
jgi:hypothetical protein